MNLKLFWKPPKTKPILESQAALRGTLHQQGPLEFCRALAAVFPADVGLSPQIFCVGIVLEEVRYSLLKGGKKNPWILQTFSISDICRPSNKPRSRCTRSLS